VIQQIAAMNCIESSIQEGLKCHLLKGRRKVMLIHLLNHYYHTILQKLERISGPVLLHTIPFFLHIPDFAPADVDGYCARFQAKDEHCHRSISLDNFVEVMADKLVDHSQLLLCVVIAAISSLFFMFAYYCFCNSSQEGALLSKLNHLERSLLASHKENLIIKHDLMTTRTKLASIEDNSFGSNDMVADLKKQLESELYEKAKLQEQVGSLERVGPYHLIK